MKMDLDAMEAVVIAERVRAAAEAEPCIYASGEALRIMALSEAHQNAIRFVSSDEFLALIARIRELEEQVNGLSQDHAPSTGDARSSTRPEGWMLVPVEPSPEQWAEVENNIGLFERGHLHPMDFYIAVRDAARPHD